MNIPVNLKHKPVIISDNYNLVDGRFDPQKTDAKGLSLGLAQWNDRGNVDISAKIWRYTGEKWSRQSEEMPLHRVLDLAILICRTKLYFKDLYHANKNNDPDYPKIDRIPLQGNALTIGICLENELIDEDIKLFDKCLHQDDEIISERLRRLLELLKKLEI
jgi:hypothetical protein